MTDHDMYILGWENWFIFARHADGRLLYVMAEDFGEWLDAPFHGKATYASDEWRADNLHILRYVRHNASRLDWQEPDTEGTPMDWPADQDAEFISHSTLTYLPAPKLRKPKPQSYQPRRHAIPLSCSTTRRISNVPTGGMLL